MEVDFVYSWCITKQKHQIGAHQDHFGAKQCITFEPSPLIY
ncbi:hypothetical protein VIA_000602 [Vibrio orientalis CIP 102891 = ATCC 33934]|uniref:Uncharacterized protein n=1 Tax=Vibrio orientalis CIP 102891 = ATCC 33934 TaxID=675816 RepID=A0ABP2H467_VIBOR|nr:hypothetical protein VIA_000602 [Vibrio orientalis CIP 102891 = ATCC 33934]